jgi:hypothetical protein
LIQTYSTAGPSSRNCFPLNLRAPDCTPHIPHTRSPCGAYDALQTPKFSLFFLFSRFYAFLLRQLNFLFQDLHRLMLRTPAPNSNTNPTQQLQRTVARILSTDSNHPYTKDVVCVPTRVYVYSKTNRLIMQRALPRICREPRGQYSRKRKRPAAGHPLTRYQEPI